MSNSPIKSSRFSALRLETLIRIRWLAVIGQSVAVLFVYFFLGFDFLLLPCFVFIGLSAVLNLFLRYQYPGNIRWEGFQVMLLLGYDILQLMCLLYLTGGLQNPFAVLLVVPVVISAATQKIQNTITLFFWSIMAISFLVFFHEPLPWYDNVSFILPLELKIGVWVAMIATMGFMAVYTYRVADESRKLSDALSATELVLQREQHVSNLDGLATAAAHELGTPLATIALVSKEMLRELSQSNPLYEDAALLRSQAERCRQILQKMSSLSSQSDENVSLLSVDVLMEELIDPHRGFGIEINVKMIGEKPRPRFNRNAAILYGMGNLVENAADFAKSKVEFSCVWNEQTISFIIEDDGDGIKPEMLDRIGDPFVTTRDGNNLETGGGLGLGVFIAKTLLERSGAALSFSNKKATVGNGAIVKIDWDRKDIEHATF